MILRIQIILMLFFLSSAGFSYEYYNQILVIKELFNKAGYNSTNSLAYIWNEGWVTYEFPVDIGFNINSNIIVIEDTFNSRYLIYRSNGDYLKSINGVSNDVSTITGPYYNMFINDELKIYSSTRIFSEIRQTTTGWSNLTIPYAIRQLLNSHSINYYWLIDIMSTQKKLLEYGTNIDIKSRNDFIDGYDYFKPDIYTTRQKKFNEYEMMLPPYRIKLENDTIYYQTCLFTNAKNFEIPSLYKLYRVQKKNYVPVNVLKLNGQPVYIDQSIHIINNSGVYGNNMDYGYKIHRNDTIGYIHQNLLFQINKTNIIVYDEKFLKFKEIKINSNAQIIDFQIIPTGFSFKSISPDGVEWFNIDNKGIVIKKTPDISGVSPIYVKPGIKDFLKSPDSDKYIRLPYLDIAVGGTNVREWKFAANDIIHSARILRITGANLFIECKYYQALSGSNLTVLYKFGKDGKFLNEIIASADARFAVSLKEEICCVDNGELLRYAYEPFLWSLPAEEAVIKIGQYLNRPYTGDKAMYNKSALNIPAELAEYLENIGETWPNILRNEIFARKGYVFESPVYQKIFENTSWYKAGKDNDSIQLNRVELGNVKLLK